MPVTKAIGYRQQNGAKTATVKTFRNEGHFNNWHGYMIDKGYSIDSVHPVEPKEE
tara:strand:+ start:636 stop:800 length:165 start_codon:yes stop_codon:yes gene_type:complete